MKHRNFVLSLLSGLALCGQVFAHETDDARALSRQLDEMQEELRIVIKEVISLNKKLDGLTTNQGSANNNRAGQGSVKVILPDKNRLLGDPKAKFAMIEFMDYQCPYCIRYARQSLPTIKQRYIDTGQLRYGIRDFPLSFHSQAESAAVAANCAGQQGKYWLMHDELVANSSRLSDALYRDLATANQLNIKKFDACLSDPKMQQAVDQDVAYGKQVGTRGTPNFFIGKIEGDAIVDVVQLSGARSVEAFDRAIQQVMAGN